MTTSNTFIDASSLDFFELRNSLRNYMKSQEIFKDYNFDGPNISALIDLLSYNTALNAVYENMVSAETNISSAILRENIIAEAKNLNYLPNSRTAARAVVKFQFNPADNPSSILIPKYYKLKTSNVQNTLTFSLADNVMVYKNANNEYISDEITIYEGEIIDEYFTIDSFLTNNYTEYNNRNILQSNNVDISSIEVFVTENSMESQYTQYENIYGVISSTKAFYIYPYGANQYEIGFGDGVIGYAPPNGSIVRVRYRDVVGADANNLQSFAKTANIDGYSSFSVTTITTSYGGAERESDESIRFSAPKYYQIQGRAVVPDDYKILVKKKFPQFQDVQAYGGEEIFEYGKVIISLKPYGTYNYVPDYIKRQIINYLSDKYTTTNIVVLDPDFYYVGINSKVYYNSSLIHNSEETIKSSIITNLVAFNNNQLSKFDNDLYYTDITETINNTDDSIVSNDTTLSIIKKWSPSTGKKQSLTIEFNNELKNYNISSNDSFYTFIQNNPFTLDPIISTNSFNFIYNNVEYQVNLRDDGIGNVFIYYKNSDGTYTKLGGSVGVVDYTTGKVSIDLNYISSYVTSINIYATLKNKDIYVNKNKYLIVDSSDISITMSKVN